MIRSATVDDFDAILDLSAEFWQHTQFEEPFDREHTCVMVKMAYDHGLLCVLEINDKVVGFCAGIKSFLLGSKAAKTGTELAWWVDPENRGGRNGVKLLEFMEDMAKMAGVKYWNMVSMQSSMPDVINRMYERMGYSLEETTWTKVL